MRYLLWVLLNLRLYHLLFPTRSRLADKYLSGSGIEIGALHLPLPVPDRAKVRYVDHAPVEKLRTIYPELGIYRLTPVDIIDNGETLDTIPLVSQDFIIANHFIEHCENPVKTLITHLSRLKPGGILYLSVPDKNKTFDRPRSITHLDHVIKDYEAGPEESRIEHYREWVQVMERLPAEKIEPRVQELMSKKYSIHFHVWQLADFQKLLEYAKQVLLQRFSIKETALTRNEFIFILKKDG